MPRRAMVYRPPRRRIKGGSKMSFLKKWLGRANSFLKNTGILSHLANHYAGKSNNKWAKLGAEGVKMAGYGRKRRTYGGALRIAGSGLRVAGGRRH